MRLFTLAVLLAALAPACERDDFYDRRLDTSAAFSLGRHAAWLVGGRSAVAAYDVSVDDLEYFTFDAQPVAAHPTPDGAGLLVVDEDHGVTMLRTGENGRITRGRRYALEAPFAAVSFAPEGGRVIFHGVRGSTAGAPVVNPNQIAILDLDQAPGADNPVRRTLRAYGEEPVQVLVSPEQDIAGRPRQLAWALYDRSLAVLDLATPKAREVVVHLTLADQARVVAPRQVVFGDVDGAVTAFVRADAASDVFALTFPDDAPADAMPKPHLNQLPAGRSPTDIAFARTPSGARVFALNTVEQRLSVIDPETARVTSVELPARFDRFLAYTIAGEGETEANAALLYGAATSTVLFVDLDTLEARRGRALTPLLLEQPPISVQALPGRRGAVARRRSSLDILDFEDQTAAPFRFDAEIRSVLVAADGERVFATFGDATFNVAALDLPTGVASSTPIAAGAGVPVLLDRANRLLIDHGSPSVHVSVVDLSDLDGEPVLERTGLLFQEVLDP